MSQSAIATAADYADAMMIARKAKNILSAIVLLILAGEIALFFVFRYRAAPSDMLTNWLKYLVGLGGFLGVAVPIVLGIDLLLIVMIMLVGRLIGVSQVISAFLWCVILTVLLFPWQAFLINQSFTSTEFKLPGVLYTWAELIARAREHPVEFHYSILFWARFVVWPVVAMIITIVVHIRSRRGLGMALGEIAPSEIQPTETK